MAVLLADKTYRRMRAATDALERTSGGGLAVKPGVGIGVSGQTEAERRPTKSATQFIWVKITGNESGGGKYTGKSYTVGVTTDVPAAGNLAESELGTVAAAVDCRVLNFAEEGQTTHALTAGTPRADTWLCHHFYTNSDGIKVCAVNALDIEVCATDAAENFFEF